jgi:hypothetical protein
MSEDIIEQMRQDIRDEFDTGERRRANICAIASLFLATSTAALAGALVVTVFSLVFFSEVPTQAIGRHTYILIFIVGLIALISSIIIGAASEFKKRFRMGDHK